MTLVDPEGNSKEIKAHTQNLQFPGVYYIDGEAQNQDGDIVTDRITIVVLDIDSVFENTLKPNYENFISKLKTGDVEGAGPAGVVRT